MANTTLSFEKLKVTLNNNIITITIDQQSDEQLSKEIAYYDSLIQQVFEQHAQKVRSNALPNRMKSQGNASNTNLLNAAIEKIFSVNQEDNNATLVNEFNTWLFTSEDGKKCVRDLTHDVAPKGLQIIVQRAVKNTPVQAPKATQKWRWPFSNLFCSNGKACNVVVPQKAQQSVEVIFGKLRQLFDIEQVILYLREKSTTSTPKNVNNSRNGNTPKNVSNTVQVSSTQPINTPNNASNIRKENASKTNVGNSLNATRINAPNASVSTNTTTLKQGGSKKKLGPKKHK